MSLCVKFLFRSYLPLYCFVVTLAEVKSQTSSLVFLEKEKIIRIEAEYFTKQHKDSIRAWKIIDASYAQDIYPDPDRKHLAQAGSNAYLEILPDSRTTHGEELRPGLNFSNDAGQMAIIDFPIYFRHPGKYYVWVRAFSTGSEDNGVHVGLNNTWPESGQRMQWCEGKNQWTWASKQRTKEVHCGVPYQIFLEIPDSGMHTISFSMREDGFEMDQFILVQDSAYLPYSDNLPDIHLFSGELPPLPPKVEKNETFAPDLLQKLMKAAKGVYVKKALDFEYRDSPFYAHQNWLAIHPEKHHTGEINGLFLFPSGIYDVLFVGVGENDGRSHYRLSIGGVDVLEYSAPLSTQTFEEGIAFTDLVQNISIDKGTPIKVQASVGSKDGKEYTRGRWRGLVFLPAGKGMEIIHSIE